MSPTQIVTLPDALIERLSAGIADLMRRGVMAEGAYFREETGPFVAGKRSIPVNSGGSALLALLARTRDVEGRGCAVVQTNTMRGVYTVPRLLGMDVRVVGCAYAAGMAMDPDALESLLAEEPALCNSAVVVYSVIGGYLAPAALEVVELCERHGIPLLIDAAHAHYLDALIDKVSGLAFCLYDLEGDQMARPDPDC